MIMDGFQNILITESAGLHEDLQLRFRGELMVQPVKALKHFSAEIGGDFFVRNVCAGSSQRAVVVAGAVHFCNHVAECHSICKKRRRRRKSHNIWTNQGFHHRVCNGVYGVLVRIRSDRACGISSGNQVGQIDRRIGGMDF